MCFHSRTRKKTLRSHPAVHSFLLACFPLHISLVLFWVFFLHVGAKHFTGNFNLIAKWFWIFFPPCCCRVFRHLTVNDDRKNKLNCGHRYIRSMKPSKIGHAESWLGKRSHFQSSGDEGWEPLATFILGFPPVWQDAHSRPCTSPWKENVKTQPIAPRLAVG